MIPSHQCYHQNTGRKQVREKIRKEAIDEQRKFEKAMAVERRIEMVRVQLKATRVRIKERREQEKAAVQIQAR